MNPQGNPVPLPPRPPTVAPPGARGSASQPLLPPFQWVSLRNLRAELRRPSIGMLIFLLGVNLLYFVPFLFPYKTLEGMRLGTMRYLFLSWFLICLGAMLETWDGGWWIFRRRPLWSGLLTSLIGMLIVLGLLNRADIGVLLEAVVPFIWLLLIPGVAVRTRNWPWLWVTMIFNGIFGAGFLLYAFFILKVNSRSAIIDTEQSSLIYFCNYMAIMVFLMLPVLRGMTLRTWALILYAFFLITNLFVANRLNWLLVPVHLAAVLYIATRIHGVGTLVKKSLARGLIAVLLILGILSLTGESVVLRKVSPAFSTAYDALVDRMLEKGSIGRTVSKNERWIEIQAVLRTMSDLDWVVGRGVGATWRDRNFASGRDRLMVHNTWLNAVYWGGVFLLLLIVCPLVWAVRTILFTHWPAALCCACYLLILYLAFPGFLHTAPNLRWVLACLMVGICSYHSLLPHRTS